MKRVGILASHNGSTFKALQEAILHNELSGYEIVVVITNNKDANVIKSAIKYNIAHFTINSSTSKEPDLEILNKLQEYQCDIVLLSGYMKLLSSDIVKNYKIINSHPSLLPKFGGKGMYGLAVHQAVIDSKESQSGVSFHLVNEKYDDGKILLQESIKLDKNEDAASLEAKIKELEKASVVKLFKTMVL